MPSPRLQGRIALVTGGSRGIGRAIALALAADGAGVAVNYIRNSQASDEVVRRIIDSGGAAVSAQADVSDKDAVGAVADFVVAALGPIDILVNNAGLLYPGSLLDYRDSEFDQMWRTNVKGPLYCSAAVAPGMIERGWGRIINLSSNAAIGTSMPGTTTYAPTKAAVLSLTKRLALELGPHGVTVNAILPGFTKTDMVLADKDDEQRRQVFEKVSSMSMLRRVGEPEDIAGVAAFLASDDSSFMTGQFLLADGGRMDYLAMT
jgi:3-oxoacyl-[acyl-carrier protein] reductase